MFVCSKTGFVSLPPFWRRGRIAEKSQEKEEEKGRLLLSLSVHCLLVLLLFWGVALSADSWLKVCTV